MANRHATLHGTDISLVGCECERRRQPAKQQCKKCACGAQIDCSFLLKETHET